MKLQNLKEKFNKLYDIFINDSFLSLKALGGEIPFYIAPFNPAQKQDVDGGIKRLKDRLKQNGIIVLEVNLFDISIKILEQRGILQKLIEKEASLGKDRLNKTIQGALDTQKYLKPYIENLTKEENPNIIFITGIGQIYPFIRSHSIINNLQNSLKNKPTIVFFPGTYTGRKLSLFGTLKDENHYRAFNLETINLAKESK